MGWDYLLDLLGHDPAFAGCSSAALLAYLPPRMHPTVGRAPPHMPRVPRSSATLSTAVDTRCTWVLYFMHERKLPPPLSDCSSHAGSDLATRDVSVSHTALFLFKVPR